MVVVSCCCAKLGEKLLLTSYSWYLPYYGTILMVHQSMVLMVHLSGTTSVGRQSSVVELVTMAWYNEKLLLLVIHQPMRPPNVL